MKNDTIPGLIGIGVDMIEIERIEDALGGKAGPRFEKRVFTEGEIAYCRKMKFPAPHFAARFAAKEAVMKALGTGWNAEVFWKGIEVEKDGRGKPLLKLNGKTREFAESIGVTEGHLSLTHDKGRAAAMAVLLGDREKFRKESESTG